MDSILLDIKNIMVWAGTINVIVLSTIIYLWLFWILYVLVMGFYRAHLNKKLTLVTKILASPFVLLGLLVDIASNLVLATVLFLDVPREWLLTTRLVRYKQESGWRTLLAGHICEGLLDVFDPSGDHC